MRICLIPLHVEPGSPTENIRRFIAILDQVRDQHPDLVCLPECSFTGYLYEEADLARFAEAIPGPTTAEMSRLAQAQGVYLCFGLLESTPQGVYDTALLLDRNGAIAGIHRKLSEKPPFINGTAVGSIDTEFGRLGMLVCADLFAEDVVARLDPALRLLLVPTARSFDGQSPDRARWEKEERQSYLDAVHHAGIPAAITNTLETSLVDALFGGALVVSTQGELLAESPHGSDAILVYDLD
jgi:predicted amidohydrolase